MKLGQLREEISLAASADLSNEFTSITFESDQGKIYSS